MVSIPPLTELVVTKDPSRLLAQNGRRVVVVIQLTWADSLWLVDVLCG